MNEKWLIEISNDGKTFLVIANSRGEAEYLLGDRLNHKWMITYKYVRRVNDSEVNRIVE